MDVDIILISPAVPLLALIAVDLYTLIDLFTIPR